MRIYLESYGCTLNHGECRKLSEHLHRLGHEQAFSADDADIIAIFTCTVIRTTELKMLKQLRKFNTLGKPLIVSGCMSVVQETSVLGAAPNAYLLPPKDIDSIGELLEVIFKDHGLSPDTKNDKAVDLPGGSQKSQIKSIDAIVPVSTGCLGECSYCITRLARGTLQSYSVDKILNEISKQVARGNYEIRLTAQDTGCYGIDLSTNLSILLNRISGLETPHDFRVRVGMMNPDSVRTFLPELIECYRSDRIFKFLHIPVQSGDDEILSSMRRKYSVSDFFKIITAFRREIPRLTVSTDIIVGYNGETDEQFQNSLDLVERLRPNIVNITRFSVRPGTPAIKVDKSLAGSVVKARSRALSARRFGISLELNEAEVGEEYFVLVTERVKPGSVLARNNNYLPVVIKGQYDLGSRLNVKITDATDTYVIGEPR